MRSLTEPLQVANDNGARRALIPIENKRNFLDVPADVVEHVDPVFYGASSAADHGLLWFAIGAARAARAGDPAIALRLGVALGIESALTNGPIKACFRRVRPDDDRPDGDPQMRWNSD